MAALDFPASPTVGQKYPVPAITGVPTYVWDGTKWLANFPLGVELTAMLPKAGGTMTGDLVLAADPDAPLEASTKQSTDAGDAAAKAYADTKDAAEVTRANAAYQAKDPQLFAGIPLNPCPGGPSSTSLTDAQKCLIGNSSFVTINNALAYPAGTVITFCAFGGGMTIAVTADSTLYWNQGGTLLTGTRTLSNCGIATAIKMASGAWVLSGSGIT